MPMYFLFHELAGLLYHNSLNHLNIMENSQGEDPEQPFVMLAWASNTYFGILRPVPGPTVAHREVRFYFSIAKVQWISISY